MKKFVLTMTIILSTTISSFATGWGLDFTNAGALMPITYTGNSCGGFEGTAGYIPVPDDPFSYYFCDGLGMIAHLYGCPQGSAFNPELLVCDFIPCVQPYYPDFPWDYYS